MARPRKPRDPASLLIAERLRSQGWSYRRIGEVLGLSVDQTRRLLLEDVAEYERRRAVERYHRRKTERAAA